MVKITNEDNMGLMARYPDNYFDLAIVDPPYGMIKNTYGSGSKRGKTNFDCSIKNHREWDNVPSDKYFTELKRVSKNQIIWGANHFISKIPFDSSCWIVWDKANTGDFADCELAWTSFNTAVRKFKFRWNGMLQEDMKNKEMRIHPTQKPVKLYEWLLINYAKENKVYCNTCDKNGMVQYDCNITGDLRHCPNHDFGEKKRSFRVLDTHLGSGSVAIACHNLGFDLTACELDKDYYEASIKRLQQHQAQLQIF